MCVCVGGISTRALAFTVLPSTPGARVWLTRSCIPFPAVALTPITDHTYRLHCHSQLVWSAGFAGRSRVALASAEDVLATTPTSLRIECADFVEPLGALIWSAMVRFGRWQDVLARPEPPPFVGAGSELNNGNHVSIAMARWAKAVAAAALGQLEAAELFQLAFRQAVAMVPFTRYVHNVPSALSLAVADKMLDGELSYRRAVLQPDSRAAEVADPFAEAFSLLREAVGLDEALPYDEPWGWHTPVAHALGALLLEQGRAAEATLVYMRDLQRWPDNMWGLHGLRQCMLARSPCAPGTCCGDRVGAVTPVPGAEIANAAGDNLTLTLEAVTARLEVASANADISLEHSCFCAGLLPGKNIE